MTERVTGFVGLNAAADAAGNERRIVQMFHADGSGFTGLLEWTAGQPNPALLEGVKERIPTKGGRVEETRTLKISGIYAEKQRTAITYECSQQPVDLRQVMLEDKKPSSDDRRQLALVVVNQVRSLHVHFRICHPALRTESFVFFPAPTVGAFGGTGGSGRPNFTRPYILDWARRPSTDVYQHPAQRATGNDSPQWYNQAYALMIVLSEIADWAPMNAGPFKGEGDLRDAQEQRRQLVTSPEWKNSQTGELFSYGFGFLDKDRDRLERCSHWQVKSFYDGLYELLEAMGSP